MGIQSKVTATALTAVCLLGAPLRGPSADESEVGHADDIGGRRRCGTELCRHQNLAQFHSLNIAELRGKVLLVDFWTYGCYNCVNTLPHITRLYDTYKDKGLIVIGVHTPEFAFEKSTDAVQAAIKRHGIRYPVAQDNEYATWNAYHNQYWPAQYIIDRSGKIVFEHAGESHAKKLSERVKSSSTSTAESDDRVLTFE